MIPHLTVTENSVQIQLTVQGDWEQAFAKLLEAYTQATVEIVQDGWDRYDYNRDRNIKAVQITLRKPPPKLPDVPPEMQQMFPQRPEDVR